MMNIDSEFCGAWYGSCFVGNCLYKFLKKGTDGCDGNCSACVYSCHKEDCKL